MPIKSKLTICYPQIRNYAPNMIQKLTICYDKIKIKIIFLFVKKKLSAAITH